MRKNDELAHTLGSDAAQNMLYSQDEFVESPELNVTNKTVTDPNTNSVVVDKEALPMQKEQSSGSNYEDDDIDGNVFQPESSSTPKNEEVKAAAVQQ